MRIAALQPQRGGVLGELLEHPRPQPPALKRRHDSERDLGRRRIAQLVIARHRNSLRPVMSDQRHPRPPIGQRVRARDHVHPAARTVKPQIARLLIQRVKERRQVRLVRGLRRPQPHRRAITQDHIAHHRHGHAPSSRDSRRVVNVSSEAGLRRRPPTHHQQPPHRPLNRPAPTRPLPASGVSRRHPFQALRERLRCKEIWVVDAHEWRSPDEDLPADFEIHRAEHYTLRQAAQATGPHRVHCRAARGRSACRCMQRRGLVWAAPRVGVGDDIAAREFRPGVLVLQVRGSSFTRGALGAQGNRARAGCPSCAQPGAHSSRGGRMARITRFKPDPITVDGVSPGSPGSS